MMMRRTSWTMGPQGPQGSRVFQERGPKEWADAGDEQDLKVTRYSPAEREPKRREQTARQRWCRANRTSETKKWWRTTGYSKVNADRGPKGDRGETGDAGEQRAGPTGLQGPPGPMGPKSDRVPGPSGLRVTRVRSPSMLSLWELLLSLSNGGGTVTLPASGQIDILQQLPSQTPGTEEW